MGSIIIAMPRIEDARKISDILKSSGFDSIRVSSCAAEVLSEVTHLENGIVISGGKLSDMNYLQLYNYLPDSFDMLLLSSKIDDAPPEIAQLPITFHASEISGLVSMILAQQARRYKKTKVKPSLSPEKKAIVERAKALLMKRKNMTEPEAHRYIQKISMDTGCDQVTTAEKILTLY